MNKRNQKKLRKSREEHLKDSNVNQVIDEKIKSDLNALDQGDNPNPDSVEAKPKGDGGLRLGQSEVNYYGYRTNSPLIENLGNDVIIYGAISAITGTTSFKVRESAQSFIAMKEPKRKQVAIQVPNLPTWTPVYDPSNQLNTKAELARQLKPGVKVAPEIIHLGFSLNLSGELNERGLFHKVVKGDRTVTKGDPLIGASAYAITNNVSSVAKGDRGSFAKATLVPAKYLDDTSISSAPKAVLDDIGTFNKRLSYQVVSKNLNDSFVADQSRRFYQLIEEKEVVKSLTDSAITAATYIYLIASSLKDVLQNGGVVVSKHGVIDGANRTAFSLKAYQRKHLDAVTDVINRLLSQVPVNNHVISKWEKYKELGKALDLDYLHPENALINTTFSLIFPKHYIELSDEEPVFVIKDNYAQHSLRFKNVNLFKKTFELFKTRTVHSSNNISSILTLSSGVATQFMEDAFDVLLSDDVISTFEEYVWDTIELWSLLKDNSAFKDTIFSYKQIPVDWHKPSVVTDVSISKSWDLVSKRDNKNNLFPFRLAQDLNDPFRLTRELSNFSRDEEFIDDIFVKALITDQSVKSKSVTWESGGIVQDSNAKAMLFFDSTIYPFLMIDKLGVSGTYPIFFRAMKVRLSSTRDDVFYWLPISYAATDLQASRWFMNGNKAQNYGNHLTVEDIEKSASSVLFDFKGYHEAISPTVKVSSRGELIKYNVEDSRIITTFAPRSYSRYTEVTAEYLKDEDIQ